ncbi:MAG: hypothetical protein Q7U06_02205 [Pseudomonadota bacterium]|nr:hypothetical protein [Pseudomonadota bacterium]
MPILGAVVTLAPLPSHVVPDVHAAIAAVPGVVALGEPIGPRLPIVIEIATRREDEAVIDALLAIPGVMGFDLAFADFSDLTGAPPEEVST